jgi:GDP-4-dehydro-6-deoxy-D-mannose reductase
MKALITGGAGFAGSHLAEYLLEQGQEVVAHAAEPEDLGNLSHILPHLRVERADLRNPNRLFELLRQTRPQRIYHLAALSSPVESLRNPQLTYEVNFMGTLNLLTAWRESQIDCRLLHVSSSEVYGAVEREHLPLREDMPLRPATPYAASKAAAELVSIQFYKSYQLPVVRVRPFNHTGPRQSPAFVCSGLARQIAEIELGLKLPTVTAGNLGVRRDFSDVRDIVRGYYMLLERGEMGEVYQLGSGQAVSIEAILQVLRGLASQPIQVVVDPSRLRDQEAAELWGDPSKAQMAVGWRPAYSLEATLRDLLQYWRSRLVSKMKPAQ